MIERITKDQIRKGLDHQVITTEYNNNGELIAHIGDYWFYACTEEDKKGKELSQDEVIDYIHDAINGYPINDDDENHATECLYYKAILKESEDDSYAY